MLASLFKHLIRPLWRNTYAHCVTEYVSLLVLVLSESCAIIMFGNQLVQYNVIQSGLEQDYVNT